MSLEDDQEPEPLTTPGAYLLLILEHHKVSVGKAAKAIGWSRHRLSERIYGHQDFCTDLALRLERYLGVPARAWMMLQMEKDLREARWLYENMGGSKELDRISLLEGLDSKVLAPFGEQE